MEQALLRTKSKIFYVPGEHDTAEGDGKLYLDRYAIRIRAAELPQD